MLMTQNSQLFAKAAGALLMCKVTTQVQRRYMSSTGAYKLGFEPEKAEV